MSKLIFICEIWWSAPLSRETEYLSEAFQEQQKQNKGLLHIAVCFSLPIASQSGVLFFYLDGNHGYYCNHDNDGVLAITKMQF